MTHTTREVTAAEFGPLPQTGVTSTLADPVNSALHPAIGLRCVVSCGDSGLAIDYLTRQRSTTQACSLPTRVEFFSSDLFLKQLKDGEIRPEEIVVFVSARISTDVKELFDGLTQLASMTSCCCIVVLPSLLRHLSPRSDRAMQSLLHQMSQSFQQPRGPIGSSPANSTASLTSNAVAEVNSGVPRPAPSHLVILRTGYVLSPSAVLVRYLRRLSRFGALASPGMTTTFLTGEQLFCTIDSELDRVRADSQSLRCDVIRHFIPDMTSPRIDFDKIIPVELRHRHLRFQSEDSDSTDKPAHATVRQVTVLGYRRKWKDAIAEQSPRPQKNLVKQMLEKLLTWAGIPWIIYLCLRVITITCPALRQIHYDILKPTTFEELLSIYNRHNLGFIQIAGYNNGVNHFGWLFADKTIVLTTGIRGTTHLSTSLPISGNAGTKNDYTQDTDANKGLYAHDASDAWFTTDAGLTLKQCIQELAELGREFYVLPNYSWISMGTLYFVPVHGSGSHVSTLSDTIEEILLFDGDSESFIFARRNDKVFRDTMYNTNRNVLLLRLTLRVKPRSSYRVSSETRDNPSAAEILSVFEDPVPSNVEIRKHRAGNSAVTIFRYYADHPTKTGSGPSAPRDTIGRMWDRLEETPVVSTLFHWFVRRFAFHVELILNSEEFVVFWQQHRQLPISKIQLRKMLRDGMTHSACVTENRISVDLFMTRGNRDAFLQFIHTRIPQARFNRGKQSACPSQIGLGVCTTNLRPDYP